MAVPLKSFTFPLKDKLLSGDLLSAPWEWFFRQVWERLSPLGEERSVEITSSVDINTFTSAMVDTGADTINLANHGYTTGIAGRLTTDNTLPPPLTTGVTYYVIKVDADYIKLATSLANAQAGTAINITGAGVGVLHIFTPWVDIEGLKFDASQTAQATIDFLVVRVTTGGGATELIESGMFIVAYKPSSQSWGINLVSINSPDNSGIDFTVSTDGQVRYRSTAIGGTASISRLHYRARVLRGKNYQYSSPASGR